MPLKKLALAAVIATVIALYFIGDGEKYLSIDMYQDIYAHSRLATVAVFFLVFFVGASCSLPVAGVLSVASGIVFGAVTGFLISLTAATLGGTVALYSTRFLFHDLVQRRFPGQIDTQRLGWESPSALVDLLT